MNPLNSVLRPWAIILLMRCSVIFSSGSSSAISLQRDLTFLKYLFIVKSPCEIVISSLSNIWSRASFFFENNVARVSQATFGVSAFRMYSTNSLSIVVLSTYIVLPALMFHLLKASFSTTVLFLSESTITILGSGGIVLHPPTTSHRS